MKYFLIITIMSGLLCFLTLASGFETGASTSEGIPAAKEGKFTNTNSIRLSDINWDVSDTVQVLPDQATEATDILPAWLVQIGQTEINLLRSPKGESTMNNLICDIMLWRTSTDFAFINFSDIYADLPAGQVTNLDLYKLIPFDRTLVIVEMNGRFLQELMEYNISGVRQGIAIAGGKVECDRTRPNFHRLNYFQVGQYPCYPQKDYRVVTTDYLVKGNAGFAMLTTIEPVKVQYTGILLRDAVRDYIQANSPLTTNNIKLDGRWEMRTAAEE
jgi:2',3'-cyclic-nucleotide 2'-phosphodiesterase (5'-nucleotidase family)